MVVAELVKSRSFHPVENEFFYFFVCRHCLPWGEAALFEMDGVIDGRAIGGEGRRTYCGGFSGWVRC